MANVTSSKEEKIAGYESRIVRAEKWIKWFASIKDAKQVARWRATKEKLLGYIRRTNEEA